MMLTHLSGPDGAAALGVAVEALAKVIHEGDWALGGSNNSPDWRWERASKKAQDRARAKALAVLRSDELTEAVRPALAAAWREGLDAIAWSLTQPLGEDGTRPSPTNPYEETR